MNMITRAVLMLVMALIPLSSFAKDEHRFMLSKKIQQAHAAKVDFREVILFAPQSTKNFSFLNNAVILKPLQASINIIYQDAPQAITMPLTTATGKTYELELMLAQPTATKAEFGVINSKGRHQVQYTQGLHYQGAIRGMEQSLATMSIFADGTVMIFFTNKDGNFNMGMLEDNSGSYVLYNDRDMTTTLSYPCGAEELDGYYKDDNNTANKSTGVSTCNKVQIYWEADYGIYQNKGGSLTNTQNYLIGLFNQKQAMYINEDIGIELSALYVWEVEDFFQDNSSSNSLNHFREYWNTMDASYNGDYAQLITRDPGGRGGISYRDVLCFRAYSYGYADINGSYNTVPTYSWDVMVVTHETGHALGSRHTHWCGWNTGSGGSCGSIDDCYNLENGSGCSTCPSTFLQANTNWRGSVMSYCHLVSGKGIDLSNGFLQQPGDFIRLKVGNANCLSPTVDAELTVADICDNDGSVMVNVTSTNFSDTPYTYSWSNSQTTKDISGISTAGTYVVTITDSNNCSASFSAEVKQLPTPGDGQAVAFTLPLCCKDTSFVFTLTADLPTDLSTCQTVGWLRTPAAINTYTDAQTAFNTIGASNILWSDNATSVSSTTAATLNVNSPTPCDSLSSYYYTPFITRKTKTGQTLTSSTVTGGNVEATNNSTVIGRYTVINDQSSLANACDMLDTPTVYNMEVTISNYTGRDSNLTIVIINADGREIHRKTDYEGNGAYSIQLPYNDDLLRTMTVQAFDFNCSSGSNCTSSSLTISAERTVTYPAHSDITFDEACVVGRSVQLSFAPDNCTRLNIPLTRAQIKGNINIYPNPADNVATLDFDINTNGIGNVRIVDLMGKTIEKRTINYYAGNNKVLLNLNNLAAGVYYVTLQTGAETSNTVKLTVK